MPRYHFNEFVLSPRRRQLLRGGNEQPLIPRYFDLLVFLVEHRHEAVHRRDIFDRVWSDVTVSDSALSQAIRTIRRVLDDDPKEPRYIGTVSRHGYRFVFTDVREEDEEEAAPAVVPLGASATGAPTHTAPIASAPLEEPGSALTRASRAAAAGWTGAAAGGALAGVTAGALGGLLLASAPGSAASFAVIPALAFIGACCGGLGGAGVGAGLSAAEAVATSQRTAALAVGAAIGGGLIGTAVQWLARWSLAALVGVHLDIGGSLEGVIIGAAAGLGYGDRNIRRQEHVPRPSSNVRATDCDMDRCQLRTRCPDPDGRRLAPGRGDYPRDRHRLRRVAGRADAARPAHRRDRLRAAIERDHRHRRRPVVRSWRGRWPGSTNVNARFSPGSHSMLTDR